MRTRTGTKLWECENSECYLAFINDENDNSIEVYPEDSMSKHGIIQAEPIEISFKDLTEMLLSNGYKIEPLCAKTT